MEKKILKKIKQYEFLSKWCPLYKKKAEKKLQKYQNKLAKFRVLPDFNHQINLLFATNLDLQNASLNPKHRDYGKKKILILGALQYKNQLALYSNCILKALNYENIILHFYDYDSHKLIRVQSESYEQNEDYKDVLYIADVSDIDASLYDISIQIIDPKKTFCVPHKQAKISYAYLPKSSYADIYNEININFDAVLYPEEGMDKTLYDEEILLPKFHLPFCIDLNLYERFEFKTDNARIGILADIKTISKWFEILTSVDKYLEENNVKIEFSYLPSYPNFQREYIQDEKKYINALKKKCTNNMVLTEGFIYLMPPEVFEKNKKWDLFVYVEDNENYMYNPIQTLRAGKCVIAPKSYKASGQIEINGFYKYIDEKQVIDYIKDFILMKDELLSAENKKHRQQKASEYSLKELKQIYNSLIFPKDIFLGAENKILNNGICFNEKNLYTKYNYYEGRETYKVKGKLIPVPCHDAGFGSILNKYVSLLVYAKDDEVYIPDWRVINLAKNRYSVFKDKTFWSFCYGKAEDENVFLKIFDLPYTEDIVPTVLYHSDILYEKCVKQSYFTEYNIEKEPNLAHAPNGLYFTDYFSEFRQKYNKAYKKYIKIKPEIMKDVDYFCEKYYKDRFNIAIHIRCAAHPDESVSDVKRTDFNKHFEKYDNKIAAILKNNDIDIKSDKWRLFVATDNDIALEYFRNKYGANACFSEDVSRLTKEQEMEYEKDKMNKGRYLIGYELQQRRSLKDEYRDTSLAFDILKDMLIMSRADYFVYQNSNVPITVSYMNPDLKMIYAE